MFVLGTIARICPRQHRRYSTACLTAVSGNGITLNWHADQYHPPVADGILANSINWRDRTELYICTYPGWPDGYERVVIWLERLGFTPTSIDRADLPTVPADSTIILPCCYAWRETQAAAKEAIEVPFRAMQVSLESISLASMEIAQAMADFGNPTSASDAGVAALAARSAVIGAYLNVKINSPDVEDKPRIEDILAKGQQI